jgi:hypothetical protein
VSLEREHSPQMELFCRRFPVDGDPFPCHYKTAFLRERGARQAKARRAIRRSTSSGQYVVVRTGTTP